MSAAGQKIIEKISAFPEEERPAVERGVHDHLEWLAGMKAELAEAEADIAAGRIGSADRVFDRALAKYAS